MNTDAKYAKRMGQPWKKDEIEKLLDSIQLKKTIETIANEHERTVGGINSYIRKIALDYHYNDNMPIEMIQNVTGLTKDEIEFSIMKHTKMAKNKIEKKNAETKETIAKNNADIQYQLILNNLTKPVKSESSEILQLKKDVKEIKETVNKILEMMNMVYEFESSQQE